MRVAVAAAEVVPAVAVKLAEVEPAGTLTEACTGSSTLLLDRPTVAPPVGAPPESVTVQDVACPEPKLVGLQATLVKVGVRPVGWSPSETRCCRCQ